MPDDIGVSPGLQDRLITLPGQALKDIANPPLAGGDPLSVGRLRHGRPRFVHGLLTQFAQLPLKDFRVHRDLHKFDQGSFYHPLPKKMAAPKWTMDRQGDCMFRN
jgi:hypothetical protein